MELELLEHLFRGGCFFYAAAVLVRCHHGFQKKDCARPLHCEKGQCLLEGAKAPGTQGHVARRFEDGDDALERRMKKKGRKDKNPPTTLVQIEEKSTRPEGESLL